MGRSISSTNPPALCTPWMSRLPRLRPPEALAARFHMLRPSGLRGSSRLCPTWPNSSPSEHIDRWKPGFARDAIPQVDGKTDVAGPKRIPTAAGCHLSAAILHDGSHAELSRAVEPDRVMCASVELE